jgi:hypothetical protein
MTAEEPTNVRWCSTSVISHEQATKKIAAMLISGGGLGDAALDEHRR